jgi:N-acetylglutamate synthase-like GNAT family acetyltransferase
MTQRRWSRPRPSTPRISDELTTIVERRGVAGPILGGAPPRVRALERTDRAAIADMAARCSDETLRRRFHAPVAHLTLDRVTQTLTESGAVGVVVAEVEGVVVGVGTLHRDALGEGEMAVLVEDRWQSAGLGSRLTAALFDVARQARVPAIVADVLREPRFVMDRLQRHNPDATVTLDGPVATIRMPVLAA